MNIENTFSSQEKLDKILIKHKAVLLYFRTNSCVVGETVEPKVNKLIDTLFPKIESFSVDMNISPDIAAKYFVFVEPTILVFFNGNETIRKSRNFSVFEIEEAIKRPYQFIFE